MARKVRLGPYGPAKFTSWIASAAGVISVGVAVAGTGSTTAAVTAGAGAISASVSVAGASKTFGSGDGFILARASTVSGAGISTAAAVGAIPVTVNVQGRTQSRFIRIGPYGLARYVPISTRVASVGRTWNVVENLGLALNISDFSERSFRLQDSLAFALTPVPAFGGQGSIPIQVTVNGVATSRAAVAGTIATSTTVSGAGANVIVLTGVGSITNAVSVAGQGATAGSVFGVGIGSIGSQVIVQGASTARTDGVGSIANTVSVDGASKTLVISAGTINVTVAVNGSSITPAAGAGAISVTGAVTGIAQSFAEAVGNIDTSVTVEGFFYTAANVLVRALRIGFFDVPRIPGDTFYITSPQQFSPYWMEFVDSPPEDWLVGLRAYSKFVDIERMDIRGRYENRDFEGGDVSTETVPGPWSS